MGPKQTVLKLADGTKADCVELAESSMRTWCRGFLRCPVPIVLLLEDGQKAGDAVVQPHIQDELSTCTAAE